MHVPAALRQFAAGQRTLAVELAEPGTLRLTLERVREHYPGVVERALDEQGHPRPHVNLFVDGQSVRAGAALGLSTPVGAGSEVWILPAVSGG